MENQQVTVAEASWLAGLWDGEGSFVIYHAKTRDRFFLTSHITMSNTNVAIIERTCQILDKMKVKAHIGLENRKEIRPNHRDCYHITISGMEKQKIFTEEILCHLVGKKEEAQLFLRFINSRLSKIGKPRLIDGQWRGNYKAYEPEEIACYEQLKALKTANGTSTTIRQTPQGEDIV